MATIIFDFDDTLFDTHELKKTIFSKLEDFGVAKGIVEITYQGSQKKYGNYSLRNHTSLLEEYNYSIPPEIHEWFSKIEFKKYLFPEALSILKDLSKDNNLILLTKGDLEFQNLKIEGCEIKDYFKDISVIEGDKESFLEKRNFEMPIYFINDKESENKIISKIFPDFTIVSKKKGEPLQFSL